MNPPTAELPKVMHCTSCAGPPFGCADCDRGFVYIHQCPQKYMTLDITAFVDLCEYADMGILPVAGGALDQTANFMEGYKLFKTDRDRGMIHMAEKKPE